MCLIKRLTFAPDGMIKVAPQTMLLLLVFLMVLPLFLLWKHRVNGGKLLPPGPPGLPFIGNLHQLERSATHIYLWHLSKQYSPLMFLRLGFVPTLVVSSPRMAEEVMKTHDREFSSRPSLLALIWLLPPTVPTGGKLERFVFFIFLAPKGPNPFVPF